MVPMGTHDDFEILGGTRDDGTHDELAGPMKAGTNDPPEMLSYSS